MNRARCGLYNAKKYYNSLFNMCDKGGAMQPNSKIHLIKITLKITLGKHPQFL